MDDAKRQSDETRTEALKQLYQRKKEKAEENKEKAKVCGQTVWDRGAVADVDTSGQGRGAWVDVQDRDRSR